MPISEARHRQETLLTEESFEQCCSLNAQAFCQVVKQEYGIKNLLGAEAYGKEILICSSDRKYMEEAINELLEYKLIRPSTSEFCCPSFMVNKHSE